MVEEELFHRALELPTPAEQLAFLDQACAGQPDLRQRVERLLCSHRREDSFLRGQATTAEAVPESAGTVLGPYKLVEPIGEGGMGTVWLAQQTEPIRRLVAVKLIKAGMDTKQVVARFEAERQALALMDHPNIARVLDGGTDGHGRPYFVMDLVKGVPITKFCDAHHLTPRQRLELFVPVCQAVQHAHQKGVIHRDLKPSNVLVALYDGTPVPKVIDFGVAKAAGQPLTDKTLVTGFGHLVGTLEYMSPEQAQLDNLDVDTRSDVYSLGVLLYELLTGTTPFSRKALEKAGVLEMLRVIREQEPTRPSTKLSTAEGLPALAANRGTEPAKLTRLVRGELDWIVLKALEKDRNRRYETAAGFARDVQRYLADEPVQACPPSLGYRLRKFARRNRAGLALAGVVVGFAAVLGGGVGWVWLDRAAQQSRTAGKVEEALVDSQEAYRQRKLSDARIAVRRAQGLLDSGGVTEALRQRVERQRRELEFAAQLEEIDLQRAGEMMRDDTWTSATVSPQFAGAFRDYGIDLEERSPAEAAERVAASPIREHLVEALDQWASYAAVAPEWKARLRAIGNAADDDPWRRRLRSEARDDLKALRAMAAAPDVDGKSPAMLHLLGLCLKNQGDLEAAVRLLSRAQRRYSGDFWINFRLGSCLRLVTPGQMSGGIRYLTAAVALRPESPGAQLVLGMCLEGHSDEEAAAAFQEAIRLQPTYDHAHYRLGVLSLLRLKVTPEALDHLTRAIELAPEKASYREGRCGAYRMLKQWEPALADANAAVALAPDRPSAWYSRGHVHHDMGRWDRAIADFSRTVELMPDHHLARQLRAFAYLGLGHQAAAQADLAALLAVVPSFEQPLRAEAYAFRDAGKVTHAIAIFTALLGAKQDDAALWMARGELRHQARQFKEAVSDYSAAIRLRSGDANAWAGRGFIHVAANNRDKALADLTRAIELDPARGPRWLFRGQVHWQFGDPANALADCTRAVELDPKLGDAWAMKGHANRRLGRKEGALADYSEAVTRNPKSAQVWSDRAYLLVELGQWAKAADDFGKAVECEPAMPSAWHAWAAAQLGAGDAAGHRKACTAMLARFRDTKDPRTAARVVAACVVVPDPGPEPAAMLKLAELASTTEDGWNAGLLGAVRHRAKEPGKALESLRLKARSAPWRAWDLLFAAMSHHRLGHTEEARSHLDKAQAWLAKVGPPPDNGGPSPRWFSWEEEVEVRALCREAEALLTGGSEKR